jgi:hypothetical protein
MRASTDYFVELAALRRQDYALDQQIKAGSAIECWGLQLQQESLWRSEQALELAAEADFAALNGWHRSRTEFSV